MRGVYTCSQIQKRLKAIGKTRKVEAMEAYKAFTPENLFRAQIFWNEPPPVGIVGIPRRKFIDVDEFGMEIQRTNCKRGYSLSCFRVRKPGH